MKPCGPTITATHKRATRTKDVLGSYVTTWSTVESLVGVLQTMRGDERKLYEKTTTDALFNFWIDKRGPANVDRTITPSDQLTYAGRTFDILYVDNPFQSTALLILKVREVV